MEELAEIAEGVEALRSLSTASLSDDELTAAVVDLHRMRSMLAAQEARLVDALDRRQLWRDDGSKALWSWLCRATNSSPATAKSVVWLAKGLRVAPGTKAAFEAGELDADRARELVACATSKRQVVADAFGGAEDTLLGFAKGFGFKEFMRLLRHWESVVDQDGEEHQARTDYQSRYLQASEFLRGMVRIDGTLDPVGGAEFLTQLKAIEGELFQTDWAAAQEIHGADTRAAHLARTPAQRRADALVEMARRAAVAPKDGKRPRPLVVVHVGEGTIARMCELASGTVIAPGLVVPRLGEADIERIVYGPRSRVIDLSDTDRFFRGGLRRAIQLRDRWCQHPTCDEPADTSQVDHNKPHHHGGLTTQTNGRSGCDTHNWWWWNNQQRRRPNDPDPPELRDTA